jgi:hypothetical protein
MKTRNAKKGRESSCVIPLEYLRKPCVFAVIKQLAIICGVHMETNGEVLGAVSPQELKCV